MRLPRRILAISAFAGLSVATGCLSTAPAGAPGANPSGPYIELRPEELGFGVSVLESLDGRISSLAVSRSPGECARIRLRGRGSFANADQPVIYINGARAADTCILDELSLHDVDRIEVQAGPALVRGGLLGGAGGVINVYMRSR